jgi:hypothetical protein
MSTEGGNKAIKDPNMAKNLEDYVNSVKAEAAYFTEVNGERSMFFVVDMQSADMMVAINPIKIGVRSHGIILTFSLPFSFLVR